MTVRRPIAGHPSAMTFSGVALPVAVSVWTGSADDGLYLGHDISAVLVTELEVDRLLRSDAVEELWAGHRERHGHPHHEPRDLVMVDRDGACRAIDLLPASGLSLLRRYKPSGDT